MKVPELREKLAKLKKEELIKLAVEFYKLVPNHKKEDYGLDNLIENPTQPKATTKASKGLNWDELEKEINQFINDAKEQNYIFPNKIIPKKERPKWRFKIKNWQKVLTNTKQENPKPEQQVNLLISLYKLLCESMYSQYFTSNDPFYTIQITQEEFFKSIILLIQEKIGKTQSIDKGLEIIFINRLDNNTSETDLAMELISTLELAELKERGIEKIEKMLKVHTLKYFDEVEDKEGNKTYTIKHIYKKNNIISEYQIMDINNDLKIIGFMFYESLYQVKKGIDFFHTHSKEKNEIALCKLINLIYKDNYKDEIKHEIETAIKNGIEPRKSVIETLKIINEGGKLPKYFTWNWH